MNTIDKINKLYKTSSSHFLIHQALEANKNGVPVVFLDIERSVDKKFLERCKIHNGI